MFSLKLSLIFFSFFSTIILVRPPREAIDKSIRPKTQVTQNQTDGHAFTYHDYTGMSIFLSNIAQNCSSIARLFSIGRSVQGREIWALRLTDNPTKEEDEPEFLYIANMHGDETIGREVLIHLIQDICDNYGVDEYITTLVNETDIYIIPTINPDGFELQQRPNANYQDLNRNFPDQFLSSSESFQPETSSVMNFIQNKSFSLGANMHGGSVCCNYPWDGAKYHRSSGYYSRSPDDSLYQSLCTSYSKANKLMFNSTEFPNGITNGADWYVLFGGLQDFSYAYNGMLHVTLELTETKFPAESYLESEWENNHDSVYRYMEQVHRGVRGFVISDDNSPLAANLVFQPFQSVSNIEPQPAAQEITTRTDKSLGDFHRVLLPGNYRVKVAADGYNTIQNFVVEVPTPNSETGIGLIKSSWVSVNFTLTKSSSKEALTSGETAAVVIVSIIGGFSIAIVIYFYLQRRKNPESPTSKMLV
eukprot:c20467_g1_i2.p1 GENE.c20467_g1_i2~~c20467_g1_i2.p1  ORF type:complete len:475 (+),score=159.19 c20467_g1_i2:37-1461(+)